MPRPPSDPDLPLGLRPPTSTPAIAPRRKETHRNVVLVIVCVAQFMVVLDATITNVALPSIQRDLGFSGANLAWVVNSYTLLFGGFLLLGGRAADLFGRKRLFSIGVALFSLASLLNGLASSPEALVAFRALQGLGAALVSPAALSIITTTFPEGKERTMALAIWGAIAAGGAAFGLLLGGALTEKLSWEWIFFVNLPIGLAALVAALRFVPESRAPEAARAHDIGGAVTVTAGLVALVYTIVNAREVGWGSMSTFALLALSVALLGSFFILERRHAAPLVRLGIFRTRSLAVANVSMLLVASGLFSMFFFVSIYLQSVMGYTPLETGFAFLPVTLAIFLGSGAAQFLISRLGVRPVVMVGLTLACIGLALTTRITTEGSYTGELLPGLLTMAFGMGLTFVPFTLVATTNVSSADAGLASGLFNTSQQVGGALGLAILSTLAATVSEHRLAGLGASPSLEDRNLALVAGYDTAFLVGAGLIALAAVIVATLLRSADVARINPKPALDVGNIAPAVEPSAP